MVGIYQTMMVLIQFIKIIGVGEKNLDI